ncbi:hypothetical protein [Streptomyces sp. NPDC000878]
MRTERDRACLCTIAHAPQAVLGVLAFPAGAAHGHGSAPAPACEDDSKVPAGNLSRIMASPRNLAISAFRQNGEPDIAGQIRCLDRLTGRGNSDERTYQDACMRLAEW